MSGDSTDAAAGPDADDRSTDGDAPGESDVDDAPRVGVVGAGVTGLSLTHALAGRGVDVVTFEATDEAGGVVRSREVDGRVVELGPQRLRLTDGLRTMVADLGVADEVVTADDDLPLYVYADGRLREVPRSLSAFVRTDLLSWPQKLRLLGEPLTGPIDEAESAEAAFVRKFGAGAYANLVGPIFGGTYGSDPARMPAKYALKPLMRLEARDGSLLGPALSRLVFSRSETPPPATFRTGLQRLPEALAEAHADAIRFETPVVAVEAADGEGFVLRSDDGETGVDRVVLTTPAPAAADVVEGMAPESAAALRELDYNPLVLVHLESDADAEGFGYQVRRSEPMRTLGVTWNASLFDRDGVYTVFMGGMHDPGAVERSDAELGETAVREFERVMGESAEVLNVAKIPDAFPAWDESWAARERIDLPEGVTLATNYVGRMGLPSRVREANRLAREFAVE